MVRMRPYPAARIGAAAARQASQVPTTLTSRQRPASHLVMGHQVQVVSDQPGARQPGGHRAPDTMLPGIGATGMLPVAISHQAAGRLRSTLLFRCS